MSALFTQCPGDTIQTGIGKVDPHRKFKCSTAARVQSAEDIFFEILHFQLNYHVQPVFPFKGLLRLFQETLGSFKECHVKKKINSVIKKEEGCSIKVSSIVSLLLNVFYNFIQRILTHTNTL